MDMEGYRYTNRKEKKSQVQKNKYQMFWTEAPKASINDHGWEDGSACKRLAPDKLSVSPRTRKGKGELTTTSYPLASM